MFNYADHYKLYKSLLHLMEQNDHKGFTLLLHRSFAGLMAERDELRMLFYIAKNGSREIFDTAMQFYELHRNEIIECSTRALILVDAMKRYVEKGNMEEYRMQQVRNRLQSNPQFTISTTGFSDSAAAPMFQ